MDEALSPENNRESRKHHIGDRITLAQESLTELDDGVFDAFYDVEVDGRVSAGHFDLTYSYPKREVYVATVALFAVDDLNQGFGKALYEAVSRLPMPRGGTFEDSGFTFVSHGQSDSAMHVWDSLVREGKALKAGERSYQMIPVHIHSDMSS